MLCMLYLSLLADTTLIKRRLGFLAHTSCIAVCVALYSVWQSTVISATDILLSLLIDV